MRNLSGAAWKALRSWGRLAVAAPATLRKVNIYIFIIIWDIMCVAAAANVLFLRAPVLGTYMRARPSFPMRKPVCWRVLRSGGGSFCGAPSSSRFFGGFPPQTPVSCLTLLFCARCGLTSSRAYVFCGWCSAGVIGRFCVGLSPRPAALRSAAFALNARPLAGCRPRPLIRLSVVLFHPCPDKYKCLLLSGALPPLTPARGARAGARCFSWYLFGLRPCAGNARLRLTVPSRPFVQPCPNDHSD